MSEQEPGPSSLTPLAPSGLIFKKIDKPSEQSDSEDSDEYYESEPEETDIKIDLISDNLPEDYENELEKNLSKDIKIRTKEGGKKIPKGPRKVVSKIPIHLKGLMGQANIMFAQGKHDIAEKMCYEIIRQAPSASEPYLTLAQLYETTHAAKSMQYLTIAAHLQPSNSFQWTRLADMHIESDNLKQAVTCYTNAIAAEPANVELHFKRIELLERLNDTRYIQRCKVRLLNTLKSKHHNLIIPLAKEITEKYHSDKEYQKAIEAMYIPFNKCSDKVTPELVNIMLELLLLTKSYSNCIDIFVQFCNIEVEIIIEDDSKINVMSYNIPDDILIDLRTKFIICMIKLEAFHLLEKLLQPLLTNENVEAIGDLYLDVAEALMSGNCHSDALKLLVPLVKSKKFSLAAVWLKHAECLKCCNMDEQAIESYYMVVRLAPQHSEVRHSLGELLLKTGKLEEAIKAMTQDPQSPEIDVGLAIKKIDLLKQHEKFIDYYNTILFILSRHCITIRHYEEIREILYLDRHREQLIRINKQRQLRGEDVDFSFPHAINEISAEEEYKLVKEALTIAYKHRDFLYMEKISVLILSSARFKAHLNEMILIGFYACALNDDLYHAYPLGREIVLRHIEHPMSWNLFGIIMQNLDENRYGRFLLRLVRNHDLKYIKMCLANNALSSINTKFALMQLVSLIKDDPSPFNFLFMAMIFTQFVQKKRVPLNKKALMQIIYGFMQSYANTRSKEVLHEVYYNLGRMYQFFGLAHVAVVYYKKVLSFESELVDKYWEILDLKRETAYNLHLIYRESENYDGARNVLKKYLTV